MLKMLSLLLAISVALSGLMPQTLGAHATASAHTEMEVEAESESMFRSLLAELTPESFLEASGKPEMPQLDPLPALTNAESIVVAGSAAVGAEVTVTYSVYNGSIIEEATTEADASGRFNYLLWLDSDDGIYQVTATAELNGERSDASAPAVFEVDRTPPGEVEDSSWQLAHPPDSAVLLQWSAPRVTNGSGGMIADPSVVGYRIYDKTGLLLQQTANTEYVMANLAPGNPHSFRIRALDAAGNESGYREIMAGTSPAGEVKLNSAGYPGTPLLVRDGSAVWYVAYMEAEDQSYLHHMDTKTGVDEVVNLTSDGQGLNGDLKDLAADRSGQIIAFASNATNLAVAAPPDGSQYAVYVYQAASGELTLISNPALRSGQPSLSANGNRVVFVEGGQIYAYDLIAHTKSLISHTENQSPGNGLSQSPAISGDGSRVAYWTTSTDLQDASDPDGANAVAVYDMAAGTHIWISGYVKRASNLTISNDGRFVAMSVGFGIGWNKLQAIDLRDANPDNWTDDYFPDNRQASERKDKSYLNASMSGDGKYVIATLSDNNPSGSIYVTNYAERFNRDTGEVVRVGNPAMNAANAQIDEAGNRVLYVREGEMYTYCYGECQQQQSGAAIDSASWSVQDGDLTFSSVNPGGAVTVAAAGSPGQTVVADIAYQEITANDPAQTKTVTKSIAMTETPAASGNYRAVFTVADGMTQIDAITARLTDRPTGKSAAGLPLRVAGKLSIDLVTEYPGILGSAWFDLSSSNASSTRKPLTAGVTHYEYWWPASADTALVLTAAGGTVLARQEGIVVNKGVVTTVNLSPAEIASSLTVRVSDGGKPVAAEVLFTDEAGTEIARIPTDGQGTARLADRHAGERIRVAVLPPSGYQAPPQQAVMLAIGGSELNIPLVKLQDVYSLSYSREVGNGSDKVPVIDSDVILTVKEAAGREVRARLSKDVRQADGTVVADQEWLTLTESGPVSGYYQATYRIAEGTAALNEFVLEVDGALQAQTYPIGRSIAGRVRLAIDAPPNSESEQWLENASISVLHVGVPYYAGSLKIGEQDRSLLVDVPYPNSQYQVNLSAKSTYSDLVYFTSPGSGQTAEADAVILPRFQFEYRLKVQQSAEARAVVQATLRDSVSREVLWSGNFYNETVIRFSLPRGRIDAASLELTAAAADPAYEKATIIFPADVRTRSLDINLIKKPEALIHGRVLGTDGKPAAGSTVTALIGSGSEGFTRTYTMQANSNGEYNVRVPVGPVQLRAMNTAGSGSLSKAYALDISGEQTADLQLQDLATVTLRLFTRLGSGAWDGPIELDFATNYHLYVSPQFSHTTLREGVYRAWATTGDTVSICADGVEAGLPRQCRESIVGADNKADIEIRLENPGGQASFRAYAPDGTLQKSILATIYDLNDNAIKEELLVLDPERQQFYAPLASGGSKRIVIRMPYTNTEASVQFTAQPGGIVPLGDIHLQPAGYFGGAGNGLEAGADWTTPGGRVTLRAVYKNSVTATAHDAVMMIDLPKGVEFAAGTLVLNGKAVEPILSGRTLEIPIGDIAGLTGGSQQLQLKMTGGMDASQIAIVGKMTYKDMQQKAQEQIFGTAVLNVTPVTMRAPEIVADPQFEVGGYAPAGSEVTVYDNGVAVGQTAVSPAGTWTLSIRLIGSDAGKHQLTSETTVDGVRSPGERAIVLYDPNDPGLETVSMQQQQGRLVTFDPASGVAVFPYVVVPSRPFVFKLKFRDVSRISDVYVQMGDSSARAQLVNGKYQAVLPFTWNLGPVSVDYRKKPIADAAPAELPTEEAFRDRLPSAMAGYGVDWKAGPGEKTPDGSVMPAGSASMRVRLNGNMAASLSIDTSPVSYTPSDKDLQQAEALGVPVYGFSISRSMTDSRISLRLTGYVPDNSTRSGAGFGKRKGVAALGAKEEFIKKTIAFTLDKTNLALTMRDLIQGSMDVADPDSFERRINEAIAIIEQICDPAAKEYYSNFAWEVKADIFVHNMLKTGIGIAAITFVPGGVFGLAFWAESYYIGLKLDEVANNELTELENHLRNYNDELCKKKPKKEPVAEPKFIWDPSGYVYEGLPDNRVEGATATVLEKDGASGEWKVWDAEWYGQTNPLTTDARGQYGWDVPEGKWKVKYEKDGFATAYSDELEVPPPQLEVNVPLVSYTAPLAERAKAAPGGAYVDVYFSKPIDEASIQPDALSVASESETGTPIAGMTRAVNPVEAKGQRLSSVIRFTPTEALADGIYRVVMSEALASYAGIPVAPGAELQVQVSREDHEAPAEAGNVAVGVTFDKAAVLWSDPSDDDYAKTRIRWKPAGDEAYGAPIEVGRGTEWTQLTGLPASSGYEFKISTVDESGNESSGVTVSWTSAADWQAPLPVTDLKAVSVSDSQIGLGWKDPTSASADLAELRLSWAKSDQPDALQEGVALPGAESFAISGLAPATEYTVTIVAVDDSGNTSTGVSVTVRTKTASGGGTGGGGGGTIHDDRPAGDTKIQIDGKGGSFTAFDGWVTLAAEPGAYRAASSLVLKRGVPADRPLASGYTLMSDTLEIAGADGAAPGKPLRLTLRLDPAKVGKTDARKLGLYRLDPAAQAGWTYVGGVLEKEAFRLATAIPSYGGTYAVLLYERSFADLAAHWSSGEVAVLVSRHLVDGVSADRFEPNRPITRAELTKLLVSAMDQAQAVGETAAKTGQGTLDGLSGHETERPVPSTEFTDVPNGAWYASYVRKAAEMGLVYGDNGRFRPNDPASREELAVLLQRFAEMPGFESAPSDGEALSLDRFADARNVSEWAREAVALAIRKGWMQGMTESELMPQGQASRAQAAALLLRVLTSMGAIEK
ncbi:S-layer homology domain-containing protein [Paenibacillus sp. UNCCL117]|nr:S-layer homology domain-containing protein [Paenibacillus sp. cl123]SFW70639.1 S-layer homology domain-containing protein [Paenibacillus sp. UNCCL117]